MNGQLKKFLWGGMVMAAAIVILWAILTARVAYGLSNIMVQVRIQDDTSTTVTYVGYGLATNKVVSELDIADMKQVILNCQVIAGLYRPFIISVQSPTNAEALLIRRTVTLTLSLTKNGGTWAVKHSQRIGVGTWTPPGRWERILDYASEKIPW